MTETKKIIEKYEKLIAAKKYFYKQKNEMLKRLNTSLQQEVLDLKSSLAKMQRKIGDITEDMLFASELQKALLPKEYPDDIPICFSHKYMPYAYIGGDLFDVIRLDENNVGVFIADVSGHGIHAALIAAMLKTSITVLAPDNFSPAKTLVKLNEEMIRILHKEHFITAFYCVINVEKMKLKYSLAGHPQQLLIKKSGEIHKLFFESLFLGVDITEYDEKEINLLPGDKIILFSDGVIETPNELNKPFGIDNIIKSVRENIDQDLIFITNELLSSLIMFAKEPVFQDDITILTAELMENL